MTTPKKKARVRKPMPIRTRGNYDLEITIIGYRSSESRPYLLVGPKGQINNWIKDRDIKRLLAWCKDCLKERK